MGASAAESDVLPVAGTDLACLCRASKPGVGRAAPACPVPGASREDPDACHIASKKKDALSRAKLPGKSPEAWIIKVAPGIRPGASLIATTEGPSSPDLTPLSDTCNDPCRSIQISWG